MDFQQILQLGRQAFQSRLGPEQAGSLPLQQVMAGKRFGR